MSKEKYNVTLKSFDKEFYEEYEMTKDEIPTPGEAINLESEEGITSAFVVKFVVSSEGDKDISVYGSVIEKSK